MKVESFPFTRYGSIKAHVTRIAKDAIPEPDASAIEGDPARASQRVRLRRRRAHAEPRVRGRARAEASTILIDGVERPLTSGMAATVEIKTGSRRLLEYLFSPLVEVGSRALKER